MKRKLPCNYVSKPSALTWRSCVSRGSSKIMIVIYLPVVMHLLYCKIGAIYLIKWPSESLAQAKHFHSGQRNSAQNK